MQYRDFTDKCYSIVWKFDKNVKNIEEDFYMLKQWEAMFVWGSLFLGLLWIISWVFLYEIMKILKINIILYRMIDIL